MFIREEGKTRIKEKIPPSSKQYGRTKKENEAHRRFILKQVGRLKLRGWLESGFPSWWRGHQREIGISNRDSPHSKRRRALIGGRRRGGRESWEWIQKTRCGCDAPWVKSDADFVLMTGFKSGKQSDLCKNGRHALRKRSKKERENPRRKMCLKF